MQCFHDEQFCYAWEFVLSLNPYRSYLHNHICMVIECNTIIRDNTSVNNRHSLVRTDVRVVEPAIVITWGDGLWFD